VPFIRLAILGRTASGTKVNIEMQVNALAAMGERSVYYWARNYADLKRGEEYDQLNRTVAINILGFNLFDVGKYPDMHSCFGIYDVKTGYQLTDKLEIHFLELLKFKSKNVKEMNCMEKWAAYFYVRPAAFLLWWTLAPMTTFDRHHGQPVSTSQRNTSSRPNLIHFPMDFFK